MQNWMLNDNKLLYKKEELALQGPLCLFTTN